MAGIDRDSPTWRAVAEFAAAERADAVTELCASNIDQRRADEIRGAIRMLDRLAELARPAEDIAINDAAHIEA